MQPRLDIETASPAGYKAMLQLNRYVEHAGLDHVLLELVKLRASQINGCAYCLEMHGRLLREAGETPQRLDTVAAWREAPYFTERERAALAWTEALTRLADAGAPDAVYDEARRHFDEKELVDLTLAIVVINGWNRLMVGFRAAPGT